MEVAADVDPDFGPVYARHRLDSNDDGQVDYEFFAPWDTIVAGPLFDIGQDSTPDPDPPDDPPADPPDEPPPVVPDLFGRVVEVGTFVHDVAASASRDRLYLSLPTLNEIAVVDRTALNIIERIAIGAGPRGLWLGSDEQTLYVALNEGGSVAALDLDTRGIEQIVVGAQAGNSLTWDVAEVSPGLPIRDRQSRQRRSRTRRAYRSYGRRSRHGRSQRQLHSRPSQSCS